MRDWYSIAELVGLPGLPSSTRGIQKVASRSGWLSRERDGRGGGREYHVSTMPPKTRVAITARSLRDEQGPLAAPVDREGTAERTIKAKSLAEFTRLPEDKRKRAEARLAVVHALTHFETSAQQGGRLGTELFARAYNAGSIAVEEHVRKVVPQITVTTLYRWRSRERELGMLGLADDYGNRAGCGKIESDDELREAVLGLIVNTPHIKAKHVTEYLHAQFSETASEVSESAVARFIQRWKASNGQLWLNLTNPDAWKNQRMAAFGSLSDHILALNQLWEMDSTPADVMLIDGRHNVLGVIDVFSRRFKLLVSKTSKATMVATLFRRAVLDWGVPEAVKTDQGKDYKSNHLSTVFRDLDVGHVLCPPFRGDLKPHVERAFRTFSHDIIELLPNYVGHDVAERVAIRARHSFAERLMERNATVGLDMTAAQLQSFCDDWCTKRYEHAEHGGLKSRTPFQVAAAWVGPVRRIEDERALDMLLAEPAEGGARTVLKKGIGVEGAWFIAAELGDLVGERVDVRLDPDDIGRIFVYRIDTVTGRKTFVCLAENAERLGVTRAAVALQAKKRQRESLQQQRELLRDAKKGRKAKDVWSALMARDEEQAAKVSVLPRASETHTTTPLEAAADAVKARDAAIAEPLPPVPTRATTDAVERGGKLLDLMGSAQREQRDRAQDDRRACERYASLIARGDATWSTSEAGWMAAMAHDPVIQSWLEMERIKAELGSSRTDR